MGTISWGVLVYIKLPVFVSVIGLVVISIGVLKASVLLAVIGAAMVVSGRDNIVLSNKALVYIGKISYPLYLWHWPIIAFSNILKINYPITSVLISFILAIFTYHFIERRFNTLVLCIAMIMIGAVGYITSLTGFPERFPKQVQELLSYEPDYSSYRMGECFLASLEGEFNDCSGGSIILWGDSHSAHLYHGLKDKNPTQYSISSCPPVLKSKSVKPRCVERNHEIFNLIKDTEGVVWLSAHWYAYPYWKDVEYTISELKKTGLKIMLVGPTPEWDDALPDVLYDYYRRYKEIPDRTLYRLEKVFSFDKEMKNFAKELKVDYFSPIKLMCDKEEGCVTTVDSEVTVFRNGHLMDAGSAFLFKAFFR